MAKGAPFERKIAKQLSLWWSNGKDDAIFWRSIQSGGMATMRAKVGKETHGHHGDIAAINPVGEPLIQLINIELKNGYNDRTLMPFIDTSKMAKKSIEEFIRQSSRDAIKAGAPYWWLILKRDRKEPILITTKQFHDDVGAIDASVSYKRSFHITYDDRELYVVQWKEFLMKVESKVLRRLWRTRNA